MNDHASYAETVIQRAVQNLRASGADPDNLDDEQVADAIGRALDAQAQAVAREMSFLAQFMQGAD